MDKGNNVVYYTIVKKNDITIDNTTGIKDETNKARCVLKSMLDYMGIDFGNIAITDMGKPYFEDVNVHFNYSHSKYHIACAISNYEVGIDIEDTSRDISDRVSFKYLECEKDKAKRLEKWVRKEAYSKLKGLGLYLKFDSIDLEKIEKGNVLIKNNDYVCAIYSQCVDAKFIKKARTPVTSVM